MEEASSSSAPDAVIDQFCPICLSELDGKFAKTNACTHLFDEECIYEWAEHQTSCPNCRKDFDLIYTYSQTTDGKTKLLRTKKFEKKTIEINVDYSDTICEICDRGDHEAQILLCDGCDKGFHTYCLDPPLHSIPDGWWYCADCERIRRGQTTATTTTTRRPRQRLVTRTALAERVRRNIYTRATQNSRRRSILPEEELVLDIDEDGDLSEELEEEDVSDEEEVEDEDEEEGSEEDEPETSFAEDDARVLDDDQPITQKKLPEVGGKRKRKAKAKGKGKKRKAKGRKRRSSKRKPRRRAQRVPVTDGPMIAYLNEIRSKKRGRGASTDGGHFPKLSILGVGMEPIDESGDEDRGPTNVTMFSRCFDRPLFTRQIEEKKKENIDEADKCDLLGSIIPEQTKTLAPGKLFSVGDGGRFKETEAFERYKKKKEDKMPENLKKQLGIETKSNSSSEMEETSSAQTASKEQENDSSTQQNKETTSTDRDGEKAIDSGGADEEKEEEGEIVGGGKEKDDEHRKTEAKDDRPKSENSSKSSSSEKRHDRERERGKDDDRTSRSRSDRFRDRSSEGLPSEKSSDRYRDEPRRVDRGDDRWQSSSSDSRRPPPPSMRSRDRFSQGQTRTVINVLDERPRERLSSGGSQTRTVVNLLDERPIEMRLSRPNRQASAPSRQSWNGPDGGQGQTPRRRREDERNGNSIGDGEPAEKRRRDEDRRRSEIVRRDSPVVEGDERRGAKSRDEKEKRRSREREDNKDKPPAEEVYDRVAEISRSMEKVREGERSRNGREKRKKKKHHRDRSGSRKNEDNHSSKRSRSRSRSSERKRERRRRDSSPCPESATLGSILPKRDRLPPPPPFGSAPSHSGSSSNTPQKASLSVSPQKPLSQTTLIPQKMSSPLKSPQKAAFLPQGISQTPTLPAHLSLQTPPTHPQFISPPRHASLQGPPLLPAVISGIPSLLSLPLFPPQAVQAAAQNQPPSFANINSTPQSAKIEDHQSIQYLSALLAQKFNEARREKASGLLPTASTNSMSTVNAQQPVTPLNSTQIQAHRHTSEKITKYEEKRSKQSAVERFSKPLVYRAFKEKKISKDQYKVIMKSVNSYCVKHNILEPKAIEDITEREIDKEKRKKGVV